MNLSGNEIVSFFLNFKPISLVDITVALMIIWSILTFLGKTRGLKIAKGLILIYILQIICGVVNLKISVELFSTISKLLIISLPIVFQREIRILLENFGRIGFGWRKYGSSDKILDILKISLEEFSRDKVGALIIIEQDTPLEEFTDNGILLDSDISVELLSCIFRNESALHDGAVLIRNNKIMAAKCILPLNEDSYAKSKLGTRHRAALGVSEISDAISIVVSEETREISVAYKGSLKQITNIQELKKELSEITKSKRNFVFL